MRAVQVQQPGPPDVLQIVELPEPAPGPDEVVIDVAVAAITFIETQVRGGRGPRPPGRPGPEFPMVPGNGVGGTVVAAGENVSRAMLGQRVVSTTGGSGGYAERVVVPASEPYRLLEGLDLRTAVALLTDGRTAVGLAQAAQLAPGDRVLVTAAGGGVGSLLVQLARRAGVASVVALAGGERKLARATELGADLAVDYRQPGWGDKVRDGTDGHGLDVAYDGVGGEVGAGVVELLAREARYLIHGMASGTFTQVDPATVQDRKLKVLTLGDILPTPEDVRAATVEALTAAAGGTLVPTIGQTFPLERAAEAHAAIESRTTLGKTLLLTKSAAEDEHDEDEHDDDRGIGG